MRNKGVGDLLLPAPFKMNSFKGVSHSSRVAHSVNGKTKRKNLQRN